MWLRFKRWLDLVAPEDGLCTWTHRELTTEKSYRSVIQYVTTYQCIRPWDHKGGHEAPRVEAST